MADSNNYLISNWKEGYYKGSMWDYVSILENSQLPLNDQTPLAGCIFPGDRLYFRRYNGGLNSKYAGLFATCVIDSVSKKEDILYFNLKNLEGLLSIIKNDSFFKNSYRIDRRSRVLKLETSDINFIDSINQSEMEKIQDFCSLGPMTEDEFEDYNLWIARRKNFVLFSGLSKSL